MGWELENANLSNVRKISPQMIRKQIDGQNWDEREGSKANSKYQNIYEIMKFSEIIYQQKKHEQFSNDKQHLLVVSFCATIRWQHLAILRRSWWFFSWSPGSCFRISKRWASGADKKSFSALRNSQHYSIQSIGQYLALKNDVFQNCPIWIMLYFLYSMCQKKM